MEEVHCKFQFSKSWDIFTNSFNWVPGSKTERSSFAKAASILPETRHKITFTTELISHIPNISCIYLLRTADFFLNYPRSMAVNTEQTDTPGSNADTKLEGRQPYICLTVVSHFKVKFLFLDMTITF